MKRLWTSSDHAEISLLKDMLDEAKIESEVRNEFTHSFIPVAAFDPELWVLNDTDFSKAEELLRAWRAASVGER